MPLELLGCAMKGCSILAFAEGLCPVHYAKWLGKIEDIKKRKPTAKDTHPGAKEA